MYLKFYNCLRYLYLPFFTLLKVEVVGFFENIKVLNLTNMVLSCYNHFGVEYDNLKIYKNYDNFA